LAADFTLASAYRFNNSVRIDFTVDLSRTPNITRRMLSTLRLTALRPLSPGSIANLTRITYKYETDFYERSVSVAQGVNDLINVVTGAVDRPARTSVGSRMRGSCKTRGPRSCSPSRTCYST
jgi:hypothetical protein